MWKWWRGIKARSVSDSLGRMLPATAHRLTGDGAGEAVCDVVVSQLKVGDRLLVRAGEVVPADGEIIEGGATQFDESMLTGESLPVDRPCGDRVAAGTINVGSPVQMRVTAAGNATVLSSIVALLNVRSRNGRASPAPPIAWRAAFWRCVLAGAAMVCVFWCLAEPSRAFAATLAVLVVACPCAFSLATLVAVASANAALARRGVLVTNPDAIESLAKVTRVVFDKTGTLTKGAVSVSGCTPLGRTQRSRNAWKSPRRWSSSRSTRSRGRSPRLRDRCEPRRCA